MSKIIIITDDNEIRAEEFPRGTIREELDALRAMIGADCELVEHVRPRRLYSELGAPDSYKEGTAMLVDEEFMIHADGKNVNLPGSWLYESDKHGNLILGTIIIIGECEGPGGGEFCGLSDKTYQKLMPQLEGLCKNAKAMVLREKGESL